MTPNRINIIQDRKPETSRTYKLDFENKKILSAGTADGLKATYDAIIKNIETQRYAYPIYNGNYGTDLEQFKGKPFEYVYIEFYRELIESLTRDNRVSTIKNYKGIRISPDESEFNMTISTVMGDLLYNRGV